MARLMFKIGLACVPISTLFSSPLRDRREALEQRFTSLRVSGSIWRDLSEMRRGVQMETTAMARRKLLMNYSWSDSCIVFMQVAAQYAPPPSPSWPARYPELLSRLPPAVHHDRYCQSLLLALEGLSQHMCSVGPKAMSSRKLIQVNASGPCCSRLVAVRVSKLTPSLYSCHNDYTA